MTTLMQHASPRTSSWASLQQADTQTAASETESKSQMLNTIIFIKSSKTNISFSADAVCAPIAVFDLEMS